ncbi:TPA: hypothetical protein ACM98S_000001, partial [Streptococcus pyogenes]
KSFLFAVRQKSVIRRMRFRRRTFVRLTRLVTTKGVDIQSATTQKLKNRKLGKIPSFLISK